MSNLVGQTIATAGKMVPMYAERLLAGVEAKVFARFATVGGKVVQSNHPAWAYGHLALYPAKVMEHLGREAGAARVPAGWEALFKNGVECRDDPDGRVYPSMAEVVKFFHASYGAAIGALAEADDAALAGPNPTEGRMRELFPTLGSMLLFYMSGHPQIHLGQVSAWRRMMGLPPA